MADQAAPNTASFSIPPSNMPAYFVDVAGSFISTAQVAKITFIRTVADLNVESVFYNQPTVQLVMSIDSLLNTFAFLKKNIDAAIENGSITKDQIEIAFKEVGAV